MCFVGSAVRSEMIWIVVVVVVDFGTVVVVVVVDLEIVADLGIVVVDLGTVVFVQSLEKCLYSFEMEHLRSWNADFVGAQLGRPVPAEHSIY